ncbi:MAG: mechanosensitive ion channel [Flavobacteriaceae bacterium]|nr:mechanosensitive ion channel [Flavobacteriaceae bacterium]
MLLSPKRIYIIGVSMLLGSTGLYGAQANINSVQSTGDTLQEKVKVVEELGEYGGLITNSLYFIIAGMAIIYLLHVITSKLLYPHIKKTRIFKVIFGTLYALILVVTVLLVLKKLGFDVSIIGKISILIVLVAAVVIFFLLPFIPRLPFKIGNMVEINGMMGIVDGISFYHTTLRNFDGTIVFIPNAVVMKSQIMNYHAILERRIVMNVEISTGSDVTTAKEQILKIMSNDDRVLNDPAPTIFVTEADAAGIKISAFCWVKNGDWFGARSDLWIQVQNEFIHNDKLSMGRRQQEVHLVNK